MREEYNKDYKSREYDKFSDLKPQRKTSYLTKLLIGLAVLLVCSLEYDNIIKPYIESIKIKLQTEKPVVTSTQEAEEPTSSEETETTMLDDVSITEVQEEPVQSSPTVSTEQTDVKATATNPEIAVKQTAKPTEKVTSVHSGQGRRCVSNTASSSDNHNELSTSEILDRITHANVVEQAKRAGVSTKGTTSEILDRITRKNLERMGY